jgi:hypothetical protein
VAMTNGEAMCSTATTGKTSKLQIEKRIKDFAYSLYRKETATVNTVASHQGINEFNTTTFNRKRVYLYDSPTAINKFYFEKSKK